MMATTWSHYFNGPLLFFLLFRCASFTSFWFLQVASCWQPLVAMPQSNATLDTMLVRQNDCFQTTSCDIYKAILTKQNPTRSFPYQTSNYDNLIIISIRCCTNKAQTAYTLHTYIYIDIQMYVLVHRKNAYEFITERTLDMCTQADKYHLSGIRAVAKMESTNRNGGKNTRRRQ